MTNFISSEEGRIQVDMVMKILYNHKEEVLQHLFPGTVPHYLNEWRARPIGDFWGHLDRGKQLQLVEFATYYYTEVEGL